MDNQKPHGQHGVRKRLIFEDDASENCNLQTRIPPSESLLLVLQVNANALQAERQRAAEKWNFDFEKEVPLNGDWEWEKVEQPPVVARDGVKYETDSNRKARNA